MSQSPQSSPGPGRPDYVLAVAVATLVVVGLVMVYSASFVLSPGNPTFYLIRQLTWLAIGLGTLAVATRIDYRVWQRWSVHLLAVGLLLLLAVLVAGGEAGGGQRWLVGASIQPSEVVKIIMIVYIADWLASKGDRIRQVSYGLVPFSILIGLVTSLIVFQPNMSTALLITATCSFMFFVAGAELIQLLISAAVGGAVIGVVLMAAPYRVERLKEFLNPLANPQGSGYQVTQAILALRDGGAVGVGLGGSQAKFATPLLWHSDTIFAVVVEELGLIGALMILGLFALVVWRGFQIAQHAPDSFGSYLAFGVTTWLGLQALINVAVITAVLPATGVTLPFISYGGSSLVASLTGVGLLLSVSRRARTVNSNHAHPDLRWRDWGTRLPGPGGA